jgi:hypothetical protein
MRCARPAILRDDAELAAVDVHGMQHPIVAFRDPPEQVLIAGRAEAFLTQAERLPVDPIGGTLIGGPFWAPFDRRSCGRTTVPSRFWRLPGIAA